MIWTPFHTRPLPLPSNIRAGGSSIVTRRIGYPGSACIVVRYQTQSGAPGNNSAQLPAPISRWAGCPADLSLSTIRQFSALHHACKQSSRRFTDRLHFNLSASRKGLVAHSDTHRDSEGKMSCVTSLVTGTAKCV